MTLPDCEIFDAHHHLGHKPSLSNGEFSVRELIDHLDRKHVRRALAMHFISPLRAPDDFVRANEYVAEAIAFAPSRLVGGIIVNPIFRDLALEEIERYRGLGFAAIKLHPAFHHYQINSPAVDEVAELAGKLGLPLLIHSDFSSEVCTPYEVVRLARRFDGTTFIMAHFGMQPQLCGRVPEIVAEAENVVLDTSQTADFPWEIYVNPTRVLGSHRLLFGSDGPECDIAVNLRKLEVAIEDYGLDEIDATQILAGNAARLFGVNVAHS
jgi:uncharacterized protein